MTTNYYGQILRLEEEIIKNFSSVKFKDDILENSFNNYKFLKFQEYIILPAVIIVLLNICKLINELIIFGFDGKFLFTLSFSFFDLIFFFLMTLNHIRDKNKRRNDILITSWKNKNYLLIRIFILIIQYIFSIVYLVFFGDGYEKIFISKIIYILIFIKNISAIIVYPNNVFLLIIFHLMIMGIIIISNFNYSNSTIRNQFDNIGIFEKIKNLINISEILFELFFFAFSLLIKRNLEIKLRKSFSQKYKFSDLINYCDELISGLNGYQIFFFGKNISHVSKNLNDFLMNYYNKDNNNFNKQSNLKINNFSDEKYEKMNKEEIYLFEFLNGLKSCKNPKINLNDMITILKEKEYSDDVEDGLKFQKNIISRALNSEMNLLIKNTQLYTNRHNLINESSELKKKSSFYQKIDNTNQINNTTDNNFTANNLITYENNNLLNFNYGTNESEIKDSLTVKNINNKRIETDNGKILSLKNTFTSDKVISNSPPNLNSLNNYNVQKTNSKLITFKDDVNYEKVSSQNNLKISLNDAKDKKTNVEVIKFLKMEKILEDHKNILLNTNKKFKVLGEFSIDVEDEMNYYLVYFRKSEDFLDIFFYDCTKIQIAENIATENKIKHKILSKIAHEFKTPLNSILGLIKNLKDINFNQNINKELNLIQALSNYTIYLISDVIHYASNDVLPYSDNLTKSNKSNLSRNNNVGSMINSKLNSSFHKNQMNNMNVNFRRYDVKKSLFFCFDILNALLSCDEKKKKLIKTELHIENKLNLYEVRNDEIRINQILLNFISNAVKFTKKGKIAIVVQFIDRINEKKSKKRKNLLEEDQVEKERESEDTDHFLKISIVDTGRGINKKDQMDIFKKDLTMNLKHEFNKQGSGVGLSICINLVKILNVKIEYFSIENKGSVFSVLIPTKILKEENENPNSINKYPQMGFNSTSLFDNNLNQNASYFSKEGHYPRQYDSKKKIKNQEITNFSDFSKINLNLRNHLVSMKKFNNSFLETNENIDIINEKSNKKIKIKNQKKSNFFKKDLTERIYYNLDQNTDNYVDRIYSQNKEKLEKSDKIHYTKKKRNSIPMFSNPYDFELYRKISGKIFTLKKKHDQESLFNKTKRIYKKYGVGLNENNSNSDVFFSEKSSIEPNLNFEKMQIDQKLINLNNKNANQVSNNKDINNIRIEIKNSLEKKEINDPSILLKNNKNHTEDIYNKVDQNMNLTDKIHKENKTEKIIKNSTDKEDFIIINENNSLLMTEVIKYEKNDLKEIYQMNNMSSKILSRINPKDNYIKEKTTKQNLLNPKNFLFYEFDDYYQMIKSNSDLHSDYYEEAYNMTNTLLGLNVKEKRKRKNSLLSKNKNKLIMNKSSKKIFYRRTIDSESENGKNERLCRSGFESLRHQDFKPNNKSNILIKNMNIFNTSKNSLRSEPDTIITQKIEDLNFEFNLYKDLKNKYECISETKREIDGNHLSFQYYSSKNKLYPYCKECEVKGFNYKNAHNLNEELNSNKIKDDFNNKKILNDNKCKYIINLFQDDESEKKGNLLSKTNIEGDPTKNLKIKKIFHRDRRNFFNVNKGNLPYNHNNHNRLLSFERKNIHNREISNDNIFCFSDNENQTVFYHERIKKNYHNEIFHGVKNCLDKNNCNNIIKKNKNEKCTILENFSRNNKIENGYSFSIFSNKIQNTIGIYSEFDYELSKTLPPMRGDKLQVNVNPVSFNVNFNNITSNFYGCNKDSKEKNNKFPDKLIFYKHKLTISPYETSVKNIKIDNTIIPKSKTSNKSNMHSKFDNILSDKDFKKDDDSIIFLVIDDNIHLRNSHKNLLKVILRNLKKNNLISKEFEILDGSDGIDALKYVIDPEINGRIKGIFIDENMEYMNGSEAVRIIRNFQDFNKINKFNITTITAFEDNITRNNIMKSGVDEILIKPLNKHHLEEFFKRFPI